MDQPPSRRKNQIPDGPRSLKKSVSFRPELYKAVAAEAQKEGHNNVSRIVAAALVDYLNRRYDVRAA